MNVRQRARCSCLNALVDPETYSATLLSSAKLTGTVFQGANLAHAVLTKTKLEGADFSGADLTGAELAGLRLREAVWTGASFAGAELPDCDLEGLHLPAACFAGAEPERRLVDGLFHAGANFDHACLEGTGLGEVDWEGVSLRGADLRDASFHMGSSRSGLVLSPIACEGSRTGFDTDDYEEQSYKAPEEIRKANLRRADLAAHALREWISTWSICAMRCTTLYGWISSGAAGRF